MTITVGVTSSGQRDRTVWWAGYALIVLGGFAVAYVARSRLSGPFFGLSIVLLLLLLLGWVLRPRATLYVTMFLTAVSETTTMWWFPFTKNLSSRESISYVADPLTISPIQIALYTGVAVSMLRLYAARRQLLPRTPLTWPLMAFSAFVVFGFVHGVFIKGGDTRIAVIESRFLMNIVLVFVICAIELTESRHYRLALYAILGGVGVQALVSIEYFSRLSSEQRELVDALNDHGAAIGYNLVLLALLVPVLFGVKRPLLKWSMLAALGPVVYVMVVAQRRSGVAALIVAAAIVAIALYWRRRRTFWLAVPAASMIVAVYTLAFWNSTSSVGFAAQAIKGIVAPEATSAEQQSSDIYRLMEAYNLNFTIKSNPLFGLGFGQAFYRPLTLPSLDFFEFNAYLPHNSMLWLWIKVGLGGFVAYVYAAGKALMLGAARVRTLEGIDLVVALMATTFVAMFVIFTWVDISWDARNATFLGWAFAALAVGLRVQQPDAAATER